ncbi:hypothetical protein ACWAMJ_003660 [Acinetobacter baumannii]|jgi:hypothetical protein|uniref:Uncharacterized protein n=2 Tax=Acinetobacter TaxID=469 RepID=A0A239S0A1_ACIJO|nr:hypothetical protein [Acinetobacter johnsonii]RSE15791.1 hypothetical protein EGT73_18445 [Acinetobacter johnsonii]SNU16051.1 Uncharacterised protein [Acinetobacter johnsonii]
MEFIFILIGLGLLFLFFKAKSQVRSSEFGKEARHIAINELGVHPGYFNYCVQNDIENIKEAALDIKKMSSFYASQSWPRLLAWTIYGGYKHNCHNAYFKEDPIALNNLKKAGVPFEIIAKEANTEHKAEKHLKNS